MIKIKPQECCNPPPTYLPLLNLSHPSTPPVHAKLSMSGTTHYPPSPSAQTKHSIYLYWFSTAADRHIQPMWGMTFLLRLPSILLQVGSILVVLWKPPPNHLLLWCFRSLFLQIALLVLVGRVDNWGFMSGCSFLFHRSTPSSLCSACSGPPRAILKYHALLTWNSVHLMTLRSFNDYNQECCNHWVKWSYDILLSD